MAALFIAFGILLISAAVLFLNTFFKTRNARRLEGEHPAFTDEELNVYANTFARMLRCATVSVRDQYDDTAFSALRQVVEEDFPLLHQKAERKILSNDCWLYKIPGSDPKRNILLMSHHDVVAADTDWSMPAFDGIIRDGRVYGRGAADTKGSLCAILFACEEMLKAGMTPPVNLYIVSSHNEELGGDGMSAVLAYLRENGIGFEVILDEGGAIVDAPIAGIKAEMCAMVAVHEKGRLRLNCTVKNESSHVSLTAFKGNPVERMSRFIHEITAGSIFIRRLNPQTRSMFTSLAPYCGLPMKVLFSNLWLFGGLLTRVLPKLNATAGGMVGTTCNFQEIQGSVSGKACTASVMLRNINREDLQKDYEAFKAIADRHGVVLETEREEYYEPADMNAPAYRYMLDCLAAVFPRYPAAPYILPAGTDAWRLTPLCNCVLRFAPTHMNRQQLGSIHAADENLDVSAVAEAAAFYKYFVMNYR